MPRSEPASEAGFALLTVILFLMIVTAAIAPFVLAARTRLDLAADGLAKERLDLLADGLVTVLARSLADPGATPAISPRSVPAACRAGSLAIEARAQDQRGLVDINNAGPDLLAIGFRALGLATPQALAHADAVVAYRQPAPEPDPDAPVPLLEPGPDASLVVDGFKHAPFEAIEELYDFRALQGVPLAALAQAFTVNAQQADILGPRMPARLAALLPQGPTPGQSFVIGDTGGQATFRIEVFVRGADRTLGYAGALIAAPRTDEGGFGLLQRTVSPGLLPGPRGPAAPARIACAELFGAAAAAALAGFPG